jgi:uncharacterized protein (TIGR02246 family)
MMSGAATTNRLSTQALLDRYVGAWEGRDPEAIAALHTEDSVFHTHIGTPPAVGRPAVQTACHDVFAFYHDFRLTTTRAHVGDDHWVLEWRLTAQMQTGAEPVPISIDCIDVIKLSSDGLVARKDVYMDVEQVSTAMQAEHLGGAASPDVPDPMPAPPACDSDCRCGSQRLPGGNHPDCTATLGASAGENAGPPGTPSTPWRSA